MCLPAKKNIKKIDIGKPYDFRVVEHIGFDNNYNYEINLKGDNDAKKVHEILNALNLEQSVPVNKKSIKFARKFMQNNGGIDLFENELKKEKESPSINQKIGNCKNRNYEYENRPALVDLNNNLIPVDKKLLRQKFERKNEGPEEFKNRLKNQISQPTNFRHLQNVGLDRNSNYEINLISESERKKVREIVSALDIKGIPIDENTEQIALKFIQKNGGTKRFEDEIRRQREQIVPSSSPGISYKSRSRSAYAN